MNYTALCNAIEQIDIHLFNCNYVLHFLILTSGRVNEVEIWAFYTIFGTIEKVFYLH